MRENPRNIQRRREMAEVGTLPKLTANADRARSVLPAPDVFVPTPYALTADSLRRRHMPEQPVQAFSPVFVTYVPVPVLHALPYNADEQSGPRPDMLTPPSNFNPLAREFVPGKKNAHHMQNPDDNPNPNPNVPDAHNHTPNPNVPGVVTAVGCSLSALGEKRSPKSERERYK